MNKKINYLIFAFFIFQILLTSCGKKPIHVPAENQFSEDVMPPEISTEDSVTSYSIQIDSIRLIECRGPEPYSELPDLIFNCYDDPGSTTAAFTLSNVNNSNLPVTLIPPSTWIVIFATEFLITIDENDYLQWGSTGMTLASKNLTRKEIDELISWNRFHFSIKSKYVVATYYFKQL